MRILIISVHYPPDGGPSAPLYALLAGELVRRGHDVTVIAGTPHYPSGFAPASWKESRRDPEIVDGVRVVRVRIPGFDRKRLSRRLLQFAAYQFGAAFATMRESTFDAAIVSNPGLQTLLPFVAARIKRVPTTVFAVADVYPQVGERLGIFKRPWIVNVVGWMERYCYEHSVFVRTIARSFAPLLIESGCPPEKIELIYDWVDTTFVRPMPRRTALSRELGLDDAFVVQYAGNIGLSQGLELLIDVARMVERSAPNVRFMFVGDGAGRPRLESLVKERSLGNVLFVPFQDRDRLPEVLATADVGLVSLLPGLIDSIPSKTYSIMASARTVLAAVDERNDAARLVIESDGGVVVPPANVNAMANAIQMLAADPVRLAEMGANGRRFVEAHHSPRAGADGYEALFRRAELQLGRRESTAATNAPSTL